MKKYTLIHDLTHLKRCHLAWRLDHKTWCGYIQANRIARMETDNIPLNELFEKFDMTPRQAKIHATKVMNFEL